MRIANCAIAPYNEITLQGIPKRPRFGTEDRHDTKWKAEAQFRNTKVERIADQTKEGRF